MSLNWVVVSTSLVVGKEHPICHTNFEGSSGGSVKIFERSQEPPNRYVYLLGNGDCKSFDAVSLMKPNGEIDRLECVNYIEKRMGTGKVYKKKSLSECVTPWERLANRQITPVLSLLLWWKHFSLFSKILVLDSLVGRTPAFKTEGYKFDSLEKQIYFTLRVMTIASCKDLCHHNLLRRCLHFKTYNIN